MNEAERYLQNLQNKSAQADLPAKPHGGSNVARIPDGRVFKHWWGLEGRLGRQIYNLRLLSIFVAMVGAMIVLNVLGAMAGMVDFIGRPVAAVVIFAAMPFALPQHTRRLHDLGWTGWLQLLFWVPIFGLLFRIFLCCKPGTPDANPFGPNVV